MWYGEMSEWLKEHAWNACIGETLSWVQIPPSSFNGKSIWQCTSHALSWILSRKLNYLLYTRQSIRRKTKNILKKICRRTLKEYIFFSGSFCMQKRPANASLFCIYSDLRYSIMSPTIQAPLLYSLESWSRLMSVNQSSSLSANSPASCSSSISGAGLYMLLPE